MIFEMFELHNPFYWDFTCPEFPAGVLYGFKIKQGNRNLFDKGLPGPTGPKKFFLGDNCSHFLFISLIPIAYILISYILTVCLILLTSQTHCRKCLWCWNGKQNPILRLPWQSNLAMGKNMQGWYLVWTHAHTFATAFLHELQDHWGKDPSLMWYDQE